MKDVKHFESLYPVASRDAELSQVVQYIKEGNSLQILGLAGVGRSNILGLLAHNREVRAKHFPTKNDYVHFVFVNFSEVHSRPLIDVTKLMFLNLVDSLRERDMMEEYAYTNEILRESLLMQDEFVIFQGLKRIVEYLAIQKRLTLVFLMDRFEEYVPMLGHAFFSNLRILRNIAKYRFSVIFTLYKPLEDILESPLLADFHELVAGHIVYLELYDEPSLLFRLSYLEQMTGKKLSPNVREEILRLTGGHWKLTRLSAEALLASTSPSVILEGGKSRPIESGDPIAALQDDEIKQIETHLLQQKTIIGALREILLAFTPAELKSLNKILSVIPEKAGIRIPEPSRGRFHSDESLEGKSQVGNDGFDETNVKYFEEIGIVRDGRITIPLLETYLRAQKIANGEEKETIVYDLEKNVIRKGETVLSDGLTAAEYRLLVHLIGNPVRVIDRDEVINVVWQEAKSTAGVTDQAVDQLIFRIRRKIEENPNQPRHLITVKGRGFSFLP